MHHGKGEQRQRRGAIDRQRQGSVSPRGSQPGVHSRVLSVQRKVHRLGHIVPASEMLTQ